MIIRTAIIIISSSYSFRFRSFFCVCVLCFIKVKLSVKVKLFVLLLCVFAILPAKAMPEMTYTVSGGTLTLLTHSLTQSVKCWSSLMSYRNWKKFAVLVTYWQTVDLHSVKPFSVACGWPYHLLVAFKYAATIASLMWKVPLIHVHTHSSHQILLAYDVQHLCLFNICVCSLLTDS